MKIKSSFLSFRFLFLLSAFNASIAQAGYESEYVKTQGGIVTVDGLCYRTSTNPYSAFVTYYGEIWCTYIYFGQSYGNWFTGSYSSGYRGQSDNVVVPSTIILGSTEYTVKTIDSHAFEGSSFASVTLPNTITSIGNGSFKRCYNLTSVNIPESVSSIGEGAFMNCSRLISISIPNIVTSINSDTFRGCSSLSTITIPSGIKSIGSYAFFDCSSLNSIIIPNGVTSLEESVLAGCSALSSVIIPSSVTSIGAKAFSLCSGLKSISIPNTITSIGNSAFSGCSGLTSLFIPLNVIDIGDNAFSGCSGLKTITVASGNSKYDSRNNCNAIISTETNELLYGCMNTIIPNSVTRISNSAFANCSGLTSLNIPNSVTSIGNSAFSGCTGLNTISIPSSVTSIGSSVFSGCTGLTSITIPSGVTSIGNYAFKGCIGLTSVSIPSTVTAIGDYSFEGCSNLTALTIPIGVKSVGYEAFASCSSLTSVVIPLSVTSIRTDAFSGCNNLTSVYMNCFQPLSIGSTTFSNRSNATLYVPMGTKEAYGAANYWKDFKEIIEVGGIVTPMDLSACPGGLGTTMNFEMKNAENIIGFQFDLQLPEGVSLATGTNGKYLANLTSRKVDHTLSVNKVGENTYRFISVSMNNEPFEGTEGTLLNMTVKVDDAVAFGSYDIKVLNAELTTSNMNLVNSMDETSVLTVKNADPGDANGDMTVSVTDVGCTINYILEQTPSIFIFDAADMNGDKKVSVTDVSMIINLILSGETSYAPGMEENDGIVSPNLSLIPTNDGYELLLENREAFIGFQFDVQLADGANFNGFQLTGDSEHLLTCHKLNNGKYRVICYSLSNSTFDGNDSSLMRISTLGEVAISNIRLTTAWFDELCPSDFASQPTGIASVEKGIQIDIQEGRLIITSDQDTTVRLLTIGGNVYRILHLRKGQNSFEGLRAGIYLINNKKVISR